MQDVDGVADVQTLAHPEWHRGARVQDQPVGMVLLSQELDGIRGHLQRRRHLGQRPAIRLAESKLTAGIAIDLIALFVDSAMVAATEHGEVRERRRPSLRPVADVVTLAEA